MKNGQVITQDVQVQIPLVLKVDTTTREVEGIATQEVRDVHGEIVDHESMKKVLADWPGNIREMHQPKAVGKAVSVVSDDDAKATIVRARISKGAPDTWEKVVDGTLSMFSIGGTGKRVTKKVNGQEETRIVMSALHEISVVDNGACPTAKFDIVKLVDGVSTECQPADEAGEAEIDKREISDKEREKLPAEDFAGPDRSFPIQKPEDVAAAARSIGRAKGGPAQRDKIKRKIIAIAYRKGQAFVDELPETWKKKKDQADKIAKRAESYDIQTALQAIGYLELLLASEMCELAYAEAMGGTDEIDPAVQSEEIAALRSAIEFVLAFLVSEFDAQFPDDSEEGAEALTPKARLTSAIEKVAAAGRIGWSRLDGAGQLWIAKAGARHSKADQDMVQSMHDTAIALGASCGMEKAATATTPDIQDPAAPIAPEPAAAAATTKVAEPAAASSAAVTPPAPSAPEPTGAALTAEDVQKLIDQALAAQKATSDATIAALQTRVEQLANEPMPGGPKAKATTEGTPVHKTIGSAETPIDVDPALVMTFAAQLASEAKTEDERQRIAENLIKFQHRTGAGSVIVRGGTTSAS